MILLYPTAELRWFIPGTLQPSIIDWFELSAPAAETQEPRTDLYLNLVGNEKMGIKVREGRLEVKRQYGKVVVKRFHPRVEGQLEGWRKWGLDLNLVDQPADSLAARNWLPVTKSRSLCTFQFLNGRWRPVSLSIAQVHSGCEMELTKLRIRGQSWWTIAFEAFGLEQDLQAALLSVTGQIFRAYNPPELTTKNSFSYPKWLHQIA